MKNILIIGGGSIGKRHLRNLLSIGEKKVCVVEPNLKKAEKEITKEYGVKVFSSIEGAFNEIDFEIAFVCSPSRFHMDQAIFCANKNCDLFVEKPLSHNLDEAENLLKIIKKNKLVTMVGSNWKFHPLFQKMKYLLDQNMIGKVLSARCQFGQYLPDWHPWEDYRQGYSANKKLGGGILLDSHEFDYLTWFLADKVKKIACMCDKVGGLEIDTEDVAEIILQFEKGTIAEIHVDYLQRFYQRNFEFFGEIGTIKWDTNDKKIILLVKDKEKEEFNLDTDYDINTMYVEEIKHFLNCVQKRQDTLTSVERGIKILELICAAKNSAENNKIVKI